MIHPGGDVAGLEVPLAGPGEEPVPGLDHCEPRAPQCSDPHVEAGQLLIVDRHAAVQQQEDGTPLEVAGVDCSDDCGHQTLQPGVVYQQQGVLADPLERGRVVEVDGGDGAGSRELLDHEVTPKLRQTSFINN